MVLPFTLTAPCVTTDYGSGITSTNCDNTRVDLVHPSTPEDSGSDLLLPAENGTGSGSITIYGYRLRG